MTLETWLTYSFLTFLLCMTPGPAVLFVTGTTASRGGRAGVQATVGILIANTAFFTASATGVAAILLASAELFMVLKWLGGAYLAWLGLQLITARDSDTAVLPEQTDGHHKSLMEGILVQISNPKALAFFVAFLPLFLNTSTPLLPQIAILWLTALALDGIVMLAYIRIVLGTRHFFSNRQTGIIRKLSGSLLILAGIRLALLRQG